MVKFRRTVPEDLVMISGWIAQDPGHNGDDASFWIATRQGEISCFVVEDEIEPLMFVRQENISAEETRIHIQFAPFDRKRIVRALREGYPLVAADAKQRGYKRITFDSKSPALIRTMLEMGFRAQLIADL